MNPYYEAILKSGRLTPPTRDVLGARLMPHGDTAMVLPPHILATLDAVTRRLLPQSESDDFVGVAEYVIRTLGQFPGDGWRYATLPSGRAASEQDLALIDEVARYHTGETFIVLEQSVQDEILCSLAAGKLNKPDFDAARWFEDLLAAVTEVFVSHPITLAWMGYSGMAFLPRRADVALNARQPWEPPAG